MLTPAEKVGLENLLDELEEWDLFNLFDTITKKMVQKTRVRSEAIAIIVSCADKPTDVLKRQKITKKVLHNYLLKLCGWSSPESSKLDLVSKCLKEWESADTSQAMDCWDIENEETFDFSKPEETVCVSETTIVSNFSNEQLFGTRFVNWFFPLYNQLQDFSVEHFWQDASLKVYINTPFENKELQIENDYNTVTFLTSLITQFQFSFLPNDSSVQYMQDEHDLVKISVSGTVHQSTNPIGLFDFIFGLIRNPEYENNYKIKHILMCMKINRAFNNMLPSMATSVR